MASLPLKLAIFFFIPKLPAIDQILPYYISTRCYGSKRIQEGEGEPDAHYRILLSQRLTGADTRTEMSAYCLAALRNTIALIMRNDTSAPFSTIGKRLGMMIIVKMLAMTV